MRWVGQGFRSGPRWTSGSLIVRFCIWSPLRDLRGSCFLERFALSAEFGQGVDACLCAKERSCYIDVLVLEDGGGSIALLVGRTMSAASHDRTLIDGSQKNRKGHGRSWCARARYIP